MKDTLIFKIKAYGRMELAMMYSPDITPTAAYIKLNRWIDRYPGLRKKLESAGHKSNSRQFTPAQVQLIVDALGEP